VKTVNAIQASTNINLSFLFSIELNIKHHHSIIPQISFSFV